MVRPAANNPRLRPVAHCCRAKPSDSADSKSSTLLFILEKVSLVALTVLSAYVSKFLFIPFFLIGTGIGIYKYLQERTGDQEGRMGPSCTQSILEQVTGIKMPAAIALVENVAITACHTWNHTTVFVPIVALSIGAYAGKSMMRCGNWVYKQITIHRSAPVLRAV